jgi:hypothetical protein
LPLKVLPSVFGHRTAGRKLVEAAGVELSSPTEPKRLTCFSIG